MLSQSQNPARESARLFLAIVPSEDVKTALTLHRDQWRWIESEALYAPEDWHLTLHFIGSVAHHRLDELRTGLNVPITPFDLHFGQPELWPHGLAVLCPAVMSEVLQQLHARLGQALQRLGLKTDGRPYHPHITLARRAQAALLPLQCPSFVWHAAGYALMESTGQMPRRYRVVQQYAAAS